MQRATITGANSTSKDFIVRYRVFLLAAVASISTSLFAQQPAWQPAPGHTTLPLWPHAAPGAPAIPAAEIDTTTAKDNLIAGKPLIRLGNVSSPTLTLYAPAGNNTGAAVVVFPGGGYRILAIDLEGTEVCEWLNSAGITCVLLKYRVPDSGPYPKSSAALQDAQRALGIVRSHAAEWHIDPHRIGVLGFSAGAHLAAALSTHFEQRLYDPVDAADQVSCRPDFAVIVYPGYLALEEQNFAPNADIHVSDKTPPSFIVQAEDDPVHVENATVYFQALKNAKVPAELHIYAAGGHGYGLRRTALPVTGWPKLVETWLGTIQMLQASPSSTQVQLPADVAAALEKLTPYQKSQLERVYNDWAFLAKYRDANQELPAPAPGEARVVFMGDSITEGWGQHGATPPPDRAAFFPGKPYVNRGISGQTTPQMLVRFRQDVIELKPKVVVLLAGTNDIAENTGKMTLEETEGNLASMSEIARANEIGVVLCSVLPASDFRWHKGLEPAPKVKALNAWIKEYAAKNGFVYVNYYSRMANSEGGLGPELSPDGVHPNKAGYGIMAPLAEAGIAEALKRPLR
ncbi:MAG TPA: GDSL-type esterase/lipase family protein [Candidatus Acidoferrum sp.]|nr:GDSL-type esterase/lipase family protein [Candidatus Acidoferrum sp.]